MNSVQATKAAVATAIFLACCSIAVGLNPSLETSQYAHNSWNVREGFFRGPVNAIEQTPDGYIWVGTEFGLYRFDGVRSVLWHPRGNQSLPSEAIRKLFVALDGTLWVGTDAGLCSLKDAELTLYPDLPAERVDSVVEDSQGTIWTGLDDTPNWRLCSIKNRVDDGKGIDEETMRREPAGHFGLPGMRERAEIVGGRLEVWSKIDSGTQIELSIPGAIAYGVSARRSWFLRVLPGNSRDH